MVEQSDSTNVQTVDPAVDWEACTKRLANRTEKLQRQLRVLYDDLLVLDLTEHQDATDANNPASIVLYIADLIAQNHDKDVGIQRVLGTVVTEWDSRSVRLHDADDQPIRYAAAAKPSASGPHNSDPPRPPFRP